MSIIKKIDLSGQRFGRLIALNPITREDGRRRWVCKCDCGNVVEVATGALRNGGTKSCGCLNKEYRDLSGQRFGKLVAIARVNPPEGKRAKDVYWECICDCGNTTVVSSSNLLNRGSHQTTSCGCNKTNYTSERFSMKIAGKRFGKLTVLHRVGTQLQGNGDKKSLWLCECDCGTIIEVIGKNLVNGNTQSCGCEKSRGERAVREYLNKKNVKFKPQYTFSDCRGPGNGVLPFDFGILNDEGNLQGLIEYQGEQHYRECGPWFGKYEREITDAIKKDYCVMNGIPLLEIPYDKEISPLIDKFLQK